MSPQKLHLINLARKALFQRAKLKRSVGGARSNFAPAALKDRAQQRVAEKVGAGAAGAEAALRKYSLPLGIAAGTGLLFAFRRPLADAVDAVMNLLERQNADAAAADEADADAAPSPDEPQTEQDDEPI